MLLLREVPFPLDVLDMLSSHLHMLGPFGYASIVGSIDLAHRRGC